MKFYLISLIIIFIFPTKSGAQELSRCRTLSPASHLLYYKNLEFIRVEFEAQAEPHSVVRIHLGPCALHRYVEARTTTSFWSEAAKGVGGTEICKDPDFPCSSRLKKFLDLLESYISKVQKNNLFIPIILEEKSMSFGLVFCEKKEKTVFLECHLLTSLGRLIQLALFEKGSTKLYGIANLQEGLKAIGREGLIFERGNYVFFQGKRGSFQRDKATLCLKIPRVIRKYAKTKKLLQPNLLTSLFVLSKDSWQSEFRLLSDPFYWLLRSPCGKR